MTGNPAPTLPPDVRALLRPEPLPRTVSPMLATLTSDRFSDPEWLFERKFDGVRCLAFRSADGTVTLRSRNDKDMTSTYPEVTESLAAASAHELVIDGEVVALVGRRTSFERLQSRIGVHDAAAARATGIAVRYYVYDLLHLDGDDVTALPLRWRKSLLRRAIDYTDPLRFTVHRNEAGEEEYRKACARGDEGVIAKRADAPYHRGRSDDWLKFKCVHDQELVIGGFTAPQGSRVGFGALLVGYHDGADFVYAGKVGTGFGAALLTSLTARMTSIAQTSSPFTRGRVRERDVTWTAPELVAEIGFSEWTRDGMLRHPRFLGLRDDKDAADVVRES